MPVTRAMGPALPNATLHLLRLLDVLDAAVLAQHAVDLQAVCDSEASFGWSLLEALAVALRALRRELSLSGAAPSGQEAFVLPVRKVLEAIIKLCDGVRSNRKSAKKAAREAASRAEGSMADYLLEVLALLTEEGQDSNGPLLMRDGVSTAKELLFVLPKGPPRDGALALCAVQLKCLTNDTLLSCGDVPTMVTLAELAHAFLLRSGVSEVQSGCLANPSLRNLRKTLLELPTTLGQVTSDEILEAVANDEVALNGARESLGAPPVQGISALSKSIRGRPWSADLVGTTPRLFYGERHLSFQILDDMGDKVEISASDDEREGEPVFVDIPSSAVTKCETESGGARVILTLSRASHYFPDCVNVPGDDETVFMVDFMNRSAGQELCVHFEALGVQCRGTSEAAAVGKMETEIEVGAEDLQIQVDKISQEPPANKSSRGKRYSRGILNVSSTQTGDFELKSCLKQTVKAVTHTVKDPNPDRKGRGQPKEEDKPMVTNQSDGFESPSAETDDGYDDDFVPPTESKQRARKMVEAEGKPKTQPGGIRKPRRMLKPEPKPELAPVSPVLQAKEKGTVRQVTKKQARHSQTRLGVAKAGVAKWRKSAAGNAAMKQAWTYQCAANDPEMPTTTPPKKRNIRQVSLSHQIVVHEVPPMPVHDLEQEHDPAVIDEPNGLRLPLHFTEAGNEAPTRKPPRTRSFASAAREVKAIKSFEGQVQATQAFCDEVVTEMQAKLSLVASAVQRTMARHKREMAEHCEEFEDILTECESEEREMHLFFKARMEEAQEGLWEAQHQRMSALTSWGASAMNATRSAEVKPDNVKLLQWIQ